MIECVILLKLVCCYISKGRASYLTKQKYIPILSNYIRNSKFLIYCSKKNFQ